MLSHLTKRWMAAIAMTALALMLAACQAAPPTGASADDQEVTGLQTQVAEAQQGGGSDEQIGNAQATIASLEDESSEYEEPAATQAPADVDSSRASDGTTGGAG